MGKIKNPNPKQTWTAGDTCFYHEPYLDSIVEGVIYGENKTPHTHHVTIRGIYVPGIVGRNADEVFETHSDAMTALAKWHDSLFNQYVESMKTPEDIIRFAYNNPVARGDDTNWEARAALKARAKELMGIDLPD